MALRTAIREASWSLRLPLLLVMMVAGSLNLIAIYSSYSTRADSKLIEQDKEAWSRASLGGNVAGDRSLAEPAR